MIDNYSDIINIKYIPKKKMSIKMRSAQFSPFNALPSYAEKINEISKIAEDRVELSEEMKININNKLNEIKDNIINKPFIIVTYFVKDKNGGKYVTKKTRVKKIDEINKIIILEENKKILINEIININVEK